MFCNKCNHKLPDDSEFCQYCGSRLDEFNIIEQTDNADKKSMDPSIYPTQIKLNLDKAFTCLEIGQWKKADKFFDQVLEEDLKNSDAYLGKCMADLHIENKELITKKGKPVLNNKNFKFAFRFASESQKTDLQNIVNEIQDDIKQRKAKSKKRNKTILVICLISVICISIVFGGFIGYKNIIQPIVRYNQAEELFANAKYSEAYEFYDMLSNYKDSDEKAKECLYIQATAFRNENEWKKANAMFEQIKDYKDSADLIHFCNFVEVASKDPTCETAGYKDFKCEICGATAHNDYKAKGHNYSNATCSSPIKCKTCGKKLGKALGHTNTAKCDRCGVKIFKTLSYSSSSAGIAVKGITLPSGQYIIKLKYTHSDDVFSYWATAWLHSGDGSYVVATDITRSGNFSEKIFNGPVSNGYIELRGVYEGNCDITIEAY